MSRWTSHDYIEHYNHGRGFVLIGHSQGSAVLEAIIARLVDPYRAVRRHLLSAIPMAGNALVKGNTGIGGDFQHIPACRSDFQLGCVIAFSAFDQPVPSDSLFGRPTALSGQPAPAPGDGVLCTNPANLSGGSGVLDPTQPSPPFAPGSSISGRNHPAEPEGADARHRVPDRTGFLQRAVRELERRQRARDHG